MTRNQNVRPGFDHFFRPVMPSAAIGVGFHDFDGTRSSLKRTGQTGVVRCDESDADNDLFLPLTDARIVARNRVTFERDCFLLKKKRDEQGFEMKQIRVDKLSAATCDGRCLQFYFDKAGFEGTTSVQRSWSPRGLLSIQIDFNLRVNEINLKFYLLVKKLMCSSAAIIIQ
ncbi:hypothetical protein [Burkholderia metallica]|uniref:hypothetical protein n=1 Tax=Burkholderia metallica TaxID=488729 RepID=UPI00131C195B|nr:hypothetical protein [Burkholderia metallica]